ncbi:hypothetical protein BDZ89DRAFT_1068948 [Hymenopellis radicata]|nr:hypothetical protein BDZ89DRAFT_1068948 [Hymenopellis radicata]
MSLIPLQQGPYSGPSSKHVLSSANAKKQCDSLGVDGLFAELNRLTGARVQKGHSGAETVLRTCISRKYDLGTAYARLRPIWKAGPADLARCGAESDRERERSLVDGKTIQRPYQIMPRRVWDLYANRVVPFWCCGRGITGYYARGNMYPVSHSWTDNMKSRLTSVNHKEWPVPLPAGTELESVRTELLNLGAEYSWLDVLCLRQERKSESSREKEARLKEWSIDVPTIGNVYADAAYRVIRYMNGLGRAFRYDGWNDKRHWLKRAWTLQEIKNESAIAGLPKGMSDPVTAAYKGGDRSLAKAMEHISTFEVKLGDVDHDPNMTFQIIEEMSTRFSTHVVDRVAGIGVLLRSPTLPVYNQYEKAEDGWDRCVSHMQSSVRADLLFYFPRPGDGTLKWRPSWKQLMGNSTRPVRTTRVHSGAKVAVMKGTPGYAAYDGPRILNCLVSSWKTRTAGNRKRKEGRITIGDSKNGQTFTYYIPHERVSQISEGRYTLVGNENYEVWVVCKPSSVGPGRELEKVNVIGLKPDEASDLYSRGIVKSAHSTFK